MKKAILSLLIASFLNAEELDPGIEIEIQESEMVQPFPVKRPANNEMENWLFAAGSIVCATIAIVVVSLNQGSSP